MSKKLIVISVVCSLFVFSPISVVEAGAKEPTLAQCQGEPSKGKGWGTFWMIYGILNAAGGAAMVSSPDTYDFENPRAVGIGAIVVGGVLSGLGMNMRHSAGRYNEACSNLLSYKSLKPGFGLEPIAQKTTGIGLVYRW